MQFLLLVLPRLEPPPTPEVPHPCKSHLTIIMLPRHVQRLASTCTRPRTRVLPRLPSLASFTPWSIVLNRQYAASSGTFDPKRPVQEVEVDWKGGNSKQFLCHDANNNQVLMSGSDEPGVSPMKVLLMALGSCASVDTTGILRKQKQDIHDLKVKVSGQRGVEHPRPYEKIHMTYVVTGKNLDEGKVKKAIDMSTEKYCGVHASLKGSVDISYDVEIVQK
ncbi:hypothetical protein HK102_006312 [Quaeritorhiza haematococci]|nr:hypothetical protein HK102_006312 [Quaeritorhiza haematococci]